MPEKEPARIALAGGGTGGHLYPAIALAQEFEKKWRSKILFIGTSYGIENQILPKMGYTLKKIWMRGLQRKLSFGNLLFPVRLTVSIVQCITLFLSFRPNAVIGTGGYVSGPALIAALLLGIPTVIQEQNSFPGLVNRFLGNKVGQVHLTFEDSKQYFNKQSNVFLSGNPVRSNLASQDKQAAQKMFDLAENKVTALIFGGSQGARGINRAVELSLPRLMEFKHLQIIWATGEADWSRLSKEIQSEQIVLKPYIDDMASAYAAADFVISRAGASTLAEIALCGLPAILVPYPFATENHQVYNARSIEAKGAAFVILEQKLTENTLVENISVLLNDRGKREEMAIASGKLAQPDATENIVKEIASYIQTNV